MGTWPILSTLSMVTLMISIHFALFYFHLFWEWQKWLISLDYLNEATFPFWLFERKIDIEITWTVIHYIVKGVT